MKTAIEQLIEELQNGFLEDKFNNASDILLLCAKYQSKEKQQVIDLCTEAYKTGLGYKEYSALDSYNETFKN